MKLFDKVKLLFVKKEVKAPVELPKSISGLVCAYGSSNCDVKPGRSWSKIQNRCPKHQDDYLMKLYQQEEYCSRPITLINGNRLHRLTKNKKRK